MNRVLIVVLLAFLPTLAGANGHAGVPDILGTWTATEGTGLTYQGKTTSTDNGHFEITIIEQKGPTFVGFFRWSLTKEFDHLHDGTRRTNRAAEMFLGVFSGDGKSFIVADHPDTGYWSGRMLDNDTMELLTVESGPHAFVGRWIYERQ